MIKANELRIGNYICAPNGEIVQVDNIQEDSINQRTDGDGLSGSYLLDGFDPIPLTPNWLERAGFVQGGSLYLHKLQFYPLLKDGEGYNFEEPEGGNVLDKPMLYVHQLQNAVYVLTGEELIFNPAAADKTREI